MSDYLYRNIFNTMTDEQHDVMYDLYERLQPCRSFMEHLHRHRTRSCTDSHFGEK